MNEISGIHHVTAITGAAQANLDFYTQALGMRLVKKTVNQDVPDTYHLFYADADGNPGTDLTFFPWADSPPVQDGIGLAMEVSLAIPAASTTYWRDRLRDFGVAIEAEQVRRSEQALVIRDPFGQPIALVATSDSRTFTAWDRSPVPAEHQIRGLHSVRLWERDLALTENFLVNVLGFHALGAEDGWHRYGVSDGGSGKHLDIREIPDGARGRWGVGGIHHVAWRVADDAAQLAVRARVQTAHRRPTEVIDRFWFHSVYFLEPGGVLFEVATDGPGFAIDESAESLGEKLVLPPWLEPERAKIESELPPLSVLP
ncbi:MAG TPA: ring-cleaving dioxygenase [Gemmatimonadaceae bacterium]|nr:ring-cleaving dioxygenase [Gemmatimonadaceae bacterium]